MVLEDTAVHHHYQSGGFRAAGSLFVHHALLHPDDLGAFADGGFDDLRNKLGAPEDIHDIDLLGDGVEIRVTLLAQDFHLVWVHGDDAVARISHVLRHAITGAEPLAGETHNGDGSGGVEDFGNVFHTASPLRGLRDAATARFSFSTSSVERWRNCPGFNGPSSKGPIRTRRNFSTSSPKCLNIKRIWLFRPSNRRTSYQGFSASRISFRPAGRVRRPESGTPSRNFISCSGASVPLAFTT